MDKQKVILASIVIGGLVFGLGIAAYILYAPSEQTTGVSDLYAKYLNRAAQPTIAETVRSEKVYRDESGFSFNHPDSITVSDNTPDDASYYTSLLLKRGTDAMTVYMKDTGYTTTDGWYASEGAGRKLVGAASLGGIAAQQYTDNSMLMTVAVDQGVLYVLESTRDTQYWDKVHDMFIDSFKFDAVQVEKEVPQVTPDSGGVIYEPEETVE